MASSTKMTGGTALVRALTENGIDTVFGLPGIQLDGLFNAFYDARNSLRVINARHEQGTAYMAFGYAQSSGRIGTYAVVPGPGLLNTFAALSTAYGCNTSVLALTGQIPSDTIGRGLGMLHEIPDQLGQMERLTKWSRRIDHPSEVPSIMDQAFRELRGGRPRPVGIEMALDQLHKAAPVGPIAATSRPATPELDPDQIAAAAELLGNAADPMIFVGGGAYEASEEIRELAEMLQAPVVSYMNGKGVLDDRHPLSLHHPAGNRLWADADVVISIGCRLQHERMTWGTDDRLKVIHVDIDPTELTRVAKPEIGIVADAAEATRGLIAKIPHYNRKRPSRTEEMEALKADFLARFKAKLGPQMEWVAALRAALPEDGFLVDEFTQVAYACRIGFETYGPRMQVSPGYQGTLGYGYATALGVQVAHPDKPVLSINGDGGFMYTMPELATAVHHGINVVAVVFADGAYGNVMRMQKELYDNRVIASQFTNPDFVKLAESCGALGLRATTPAELRARIEEGFAAARPTLIEVPVGEMPEPWPVIRPGPSRP
ncbi:thiamine pyrophosphate-binding protein [Nisaea acidiphila]|uniref:Thiamine pyrophosphate-binding protein n=1 Tax=Nisaea acidiphila TaxID=1862145 RepID=A0A9J7AQM7_9PROT|nr:thiamine pyrophosphate-dependent enzyme [Nisaea acidiphila]UUX49186.1 thiamine pyrophosphate-binding protein [Nisaea acidiphila]